MSAIAGLVVLAVSAVVPVIVARTLLGVMIAPLTRRPAPATTRTQARQ